MTLDEMRVTHEMTPSHAQKFPQIEQVHPFIETGSIPSNLQTPHACTRSTNQLYSYARRRRCEGGIELVRRLLLIRRGETNPPNGLRLSLVRIERPDLERREMLLSKHVDDPIFVRQVDCQEGAVL
jgi:hypothetical protein